MIYYEYYRDRMTQQIMWFQNDLTFNRHVHRGVEFICATDDLCTVYYANNEYRLRRGDILFIHSGQEHSIVDEGNNVCFFIPVRYLEHYSKQTENCVPENCYLRAERCRELYDLVIQAKVCEGNKNETLMHGFANFILGKVLEQIRFVPIKSEIIHDFDLVSKICSYINDHFREEITLELLAKEFFYNKYHLSKMFDRELQCTLKEYVNDVRLDRFVKEFRQDKSMECQIFECGFKSRQTFYRVFKRKYGVSPNRYFVS